MAKDKIHDAVKNALVKDGWSITAEPKTIQYLDITVYADLEASKPQDGVQDLRIIVVEVKSFGSPSPVDDLEKALGQYQLYQGYLERLVPNCKLYLAISSAVHRGFFLRESIQLIVERFAVALLVVDVSAEEVVAWTS